MTEPVHTVDSRGRRCPLPVIDLARAAADRPAGAVLVVLTDDPAAATDIPAWCQMRGHDYLEARPIESSAELAHHVRLRATDA